MTICSKGLRCPSSVEAALFHVEQRLGNCQMASLIPSRRSRVAAILRSQLASNDLDIQRGSVGRSDEARLSLAADQCRIRGPDDGVSVFKPRLEGTQVFMWRRPADP